MEEGKTKEQLINELMELRQQVAELEAVGIERRRAEEELHSVHRKLRATLDAIQENMNVVDLDFNLTDVNDILLEAFGLPDRESVLGRKCFEALKGRKDLCPNCAVAEAYRTKAPVYRTSTPEDEASTGGRGFEIFAYPIMDEHGNLSGAVEFARDITEHKRVEEKLRESEEKYRTLVESADESIFIMDQDGVFLFMNSVAAQLLGGQPEDFIGKTMWDIFPREVAARQIADVRGVIQSGQGCVVESVTILQGEPRCYRTSIQPIRDYLGKVNTALLIATDITEHKQAEEEIRQRTAQLEALRQVGLEITVELDLDALLRSIVSQAVELVKATAGGLYFYRPDLDVLVWVMAVGPHMSPIGTVLRCGEGLSGKVWETGESLIVDDYQQWEGRAAVYEGYPFRAVVGVPVNWGGNLVGVLNVLADSPHAFSVADAELLELFATQAAIAIRNACLFEGEREERELAKALEEAAAVVSSTLDPDQVLDRILQQVGRVVSNDAANIMLIAGDQAHMVRWRGYERFGAGEFISTVVFRVPEMLNFQQMLESRRAMVIPDTATYPGWVRFPETEWLQSYAAAPIIVRSEVIGFLNVDSATPNFFTQAHAEALCAFADHAAAAIENARLYEETRRWAEEVTSVYNIGVATTSTLSLGEVLKLVCEQVSRLMEVSSFYIALYDEEKEELRFELALDEGVPVEKFSRKTANGGGLSGWIVQSRKPLLLRDMEKEELPIEAIVVGEPTRSWLGVPLLCRDQVVGVMGVQSYQPNAFDEDDQQLLSTIAAQVAIAIENARLFAETEGKANDLGLLLGTSTAISSTLDLDQILDTLAQQITTSLVATFCHISLLDETEENLTICAASPVRVQKAEESRGRRCPLAMLPWHRQVIETGQAVVLRQDVPELALSDEERKMALTEEVKSAALIPLIVGGRVLGVISLGEDRSWERSPFTQEKMELCQSIATQAAVAIENGRLYEELQQSFIQTIAALAAAVDAKDPYTGGHSQRVTELAAALAQELDLGSEEIELIRYAGLLHDVGKIGISEQILLKPGPLNVEEWEVVRRHPALGANIVERAASLYELVPVILYHHERYNGRGYPAGLKGEDIPLKARILAVADAYEAMTSDRAYRPAMTVEQALATLRQGAGEQWDGKIVDTLHKIIREQGHLGNRSAGNNELMR